MTYAKRFSGSVRHVGDWNYRNGRWFDITISRDATNQHHWVGFRERKGNIVAFLDRTLALPPDARPFR